MPQHTAKNTLLALVAEATGATARPVPDTAAVGAWVQNLYALLFPVRINDRTAEAQYALVSDQLTTLLWSFTDDVEVTNERFFAQLPSVFKLLQTDLEAFVQSDPAASNRVEVVAAYPGFFAVATYRLAHLLSQLGVPLHPRLCTEYAHSQTGIDIHPRAQIGKAFFIDHGTGVVIGETSVVGDHVKIYQGVTLGALHVSKALAQTKRHPSIGDHVVIYANATILGGETSIGHHSVIGGSAWLTRSVEPWSVVQHTAQVQIRSKNAAAEINFVI